MKNIITLILVAASLMMAVAPAQAQDLSISGSVDTYFRGNLSGERDDAPGTSFANLPGFSLGMVNLVTGIEGEKVGFVGDLVFGPRGADAVFLSTGSANIVNQLYAYWNVSDNVTFTLGNFNTFLGYEVISPTANFNYSTSYMFSYGPFSHTGAKVDIAAGDFSIMAAVMNATDETDFNISDAYYFGTQLGYDFGKGSIYLNGLFGDGYTQFDVTAGADITDALYLGLNATVADELFSGLAVYLQAALSDSFKLGVRAETFNQDTADLGALPQLMTAETSSAFDFTISANYTVGSLTLIPEIRFDALTDAAFADGEESLSSFILAAVYGF